MKKKNIITLALVAVIALVVILCVTKCNKPESSASDTPVVETSAVVPTAEPKEEPAVEPSTEQAKTEEAEAKTETEPEQATEVKAEEPGPAIEEPAEQPVEEPVEEEVPVEQPAEEPIVEEPVVEEAVTTEQPVEPEVEPVVEQPASEPVEEPAKEEPLVEEPLAEPAIEEPVAQSYARTINLYGYEATVEAYENIVEISYPNFVTYEEVEAAAAVAYEAFSQYLAGSVLYVDASAGTAVLTLAEIPSEADFNYALDLVETALPVYVASLFQEPATEEPEVVPVVESKAEEVETTVELVIEEPVRLEVEAKPEAEVVVSYVPVEKKYTLFTEGDITVVADKGKATITYPAEYISEADIATAALAAFEAYSSVYDLSAVYYSVEDGILTLYYPVEWGTEELALAESSVMQVLPGYVEAVIASYAPKAEEPVVEEVTAQVVEQPVEEKPATELVSEPAAQPVVEEIPEIEPITEMVALSELKDIKKNSVSVILNPSVNLAGFGISAKGFNWALGARYEYNINEKLAVGGKVVYNFKFGYAQINALGRYTFLNLDEKSNVYALLSLGVDYTFMAKRPGFVVELGAGYDYQILDNHTAFGELSVQFSTIRRFDIAASFGVKYSF